MGGVPTNYHGEVVTKKGTLTPLLLRTCPHLAVTDVLLRCLLCSALLGLAQATTPTAWSLVSWLLARPLACPSTEPTASAPTRFSTSSSSVAPSPTASRRPSRRVRAPASLSLSPSSRT
jgi:hypothetical protein